MRKPNQNSADPEERRLANLMSSYISPSSSSFDQDFRDKIEELCPIQTHKSAGHWTYKTCKQDAIDLQATGPADWRAKGGGGYTAAKKNGWLPQIGKELGWKTPKPADYWTYKTCKQDAIDLKVTGSRDWQEKGGGGYTAAHVNKWLPQIRKELGW